jgi:hypothetical protein
MRGHALQGLANGTARDWPQEVFVQISEAGVGRAVRTKKWVYAVESPKSTADGAKKQAGSKGLQSGSSDIYIEKYLFDLEADPGQHNNLVSDPRHSQVRTDLCALLKRRMAQAGEKEPEIRPV